MEYHQLKPENGDAKLADSKSCEKTVEVEAEKTGDAAKAEEERNKRFLQCPAAVTMGHIMKFLRMKYALTEGHRVSDRSW